MNDHFRIARILRETAELLESGQAEHGSYDSVPGMQKDGTNVKLSVSTHFRGDDGRMNRIIVIEFRAQNAVYYTLVTR